MDLNILWFILVTVLFSGFFILEGFDFGVGSLLPFVSKTDNERRVVFNSIGPHWDGNEVWLLTAGGAIFAAFPHWYATLFSGFYLALFAILLALIGRGIAIEFRSKMPSAAWRKAWDIIFFLGSVLPGVLFGVAVSNFITGVPIDANMEYAGNFFTLLTPFSLLGGVMLALVFAYHGSLFLSLKSGMPSVSQRINSIRPKLGAVTIIVAVAWLVYAFFASVLFQSTISVIAVVIAAIMLVISYLLQFKQKFGLAFVASSLAILGVTIAVFASMFPNVMISTINEAYNLTIYTASSTPYTLKVMSIVAGIFVPIVLLYQAWSYWIFRKRITEKELHY